MMQNSAHAKYAVLIVEDDPFVRLEAASMAEDAGFIAYQASNADDAILLLEQHDEIRVLFTDIEMPGSMDGLKLAKAVRDRWPPVVIMVASGRVKPEQDQLPEDGIFFPKPYSSSAFANALQAAVAKFG